jgi:AcrR family transcriptional regulator
MSTKDKILEAMLEVVAEKGIEGSSMSLVVKRSKVSAGSIYHHFESKDAILEELYSVLKQQMGMALTERIHSKDSYKEKFEKYWKSLFDFYSNNESKFRVLELCHNSPSFSERVKQRNEVYYLPVVQFLQDGIERELLRKMDLNLMVSLVHASVTATVLFKFKIGNEQFKNHHLKVAIETSWKGIEL